MPELCELGDFSPGWLFLHLGAASAPQGDYNCFLTDIDDGGNIVTMAFHRYPSGNRAMVESLMLFNRLSAAGACDRSLPGWPVQRMTGGRF
jgi:hypothetical protein